MTAVTVPPVSAGLGDLPSVSLTELLERAELMTRVDRKYVLDAADLPTVLDAVRADLRVLDVQGQREFGYQSDYLDTAQLTSYLGAAHRRRRRFKLRVRTYLDTGARFLEVKTRGPRGTTVKDRMPYAGSVAALDGDGHRFVADRLRHARVECALDTLAPSLRTSYDRATLLIDTTDSRLTIDSNLIVASPDGRALRLPDKVVVESKAARGASAIDRALWRLGHRPCSISKYGTGLAALRPELPANHWHSTLLRHFADNPRKAHHA